MLATRPSLRLTDCHGRQIPILGTRSITQIQIQIQIRFTDITRQIPIDGSVQSENKDGIPQAMADRRTMPEKVFVDQHVFLSNVTKNSITDTFYRCVRFKRELSGPWKTRGAIASYFASEGGRELSVLLIQVLRPMMILLWFRFP